MSNIEYKPAEKLVVHLSRADSKFPWGFRLQGGIDFSTPLSIQSVNPNSVSEQCGLKPGDAILAINNHNSDAMTHDDAKDEIMRSNNHITMLVERGAVKIWKPQVTPMSELRPQELRTITAATGEDVTPVQRTSLAINKPPDSPCTIGSSHNRSAQPFGKPKTAVPNVVHAQYNSPMGLYSANNIADSFAKQTVGIQNQMQSMDLNGAPETGQERGQQEVTVTDTPSIEPPYDACTQSSSVITDTPTTFSSSSAALSPTGNRTASPFKPSNSPTTASPPPASPATSGTSAASTTGFRPVSPFNPKITNSSPTSLTTTGTAASASTVPGYRPVSPFLPTATTTATTPTTFTSGGTKDTVGSVSGYRPVSPFQPNANIANTSNTTLTSTPSTPYTHDDSDTAAPAMQSRSFQKVQQQLDAQELEEEESNNNSTNVNIRGFKSVSAPVAKPPSERPQQPSMRCGGCDNLATGVIVKASGVPYHVACFKCASCSMNLKQKGFFRVDGQLYCETHAKRHAKPPGSDMVAIATYR